MNVRNYQKELEKLIEQLQKENIVPTLLLHSCCAPCSSYCLMYLAKYFKITVFYYNPNISMEEEYRHRVKEQIRLINTLNEEDVCHPINFIEGDYEPQLFYNVSKGLEHCEEGGERCFRCYELRLRRTAQVAAGIMDKVQEGYAATGIMNKVEEECAAADIMTGVEEECMIADADKVCINKEYDYFTTTLTISPLKNAQKLNEIGEQLAAEYGVSFLNSDFKKKNGYKMSVELSKKYDLYRQNYCGCAFSKAQAEKEGRL